VDDCGQYGRELRPIKNMFPLFPPEMIVKGLFFFIVMLGGGTLWHLQKFLQCIKYFKPEFTLLASIYCTKGFHCYISIHVYNVLQSYSLPLLLFFIILLPFSTFNGFHYSVFIHEYNVLWSYLPPPSPYFEAYLLRKIGREDVFTVKFWKQVREFPNQAEWKEPVLSQLETEKS
jgi:hypothetical protein